MSTGIYDVIVVGAGIEGSCTAHYLASRHTKNVLLLEQFDALHTRGSSHGGSRITRRAYNQSIYVKMMEEAFPMWEEIEKKSGKQIYWKTGIIGFANMGKEGYESYLKSMIDNDISFQQWTGEEANKLYPCQLDVDPSIECIYEEDGGILKASVGLRAVQELFVSNGGTFKDCHKVTGILPGPVITIQTDKDSFRAKKVVLATGAWTNEVLNSTGLGLDLPMKIHRAEVLYFKVDDPDVFAAAKFPVFLSLHSAVLRDPSIYGTPILEYPGLLKVCQYFNDLEIDSPEKRDTVTTSVTLKNVSKFIDNHFKGVSREPAIFELCLYVETPDNNPFIDTHPIHRNIVIAGGFSHGYKMAPVFGKVIGELTMNCPPPYELSYFKIDRFKLSNNN